MYPIKLFQAKELADDIKEAFEQNILELDWMDEKTKSLAIQKVTTDNYFSFMWNTICEGPFKQYRLFLKTWPTYGEGTIKLSRHMTR